jgi:DnaJ-class molecular chaperone
MVEHEQQRARRRCERCRGTGRIPGVTKVRPTGKGIGMGFAPGPCPECDGAGYIQDGGHYAETDALRIRRHDESRRTRT